MRYFTGIEVEGPNKGMSTFFIRGDVVQAPPSAALQDFEQIYLGAGNIRGVHPQILTALYDIEKKHITIEFDTIEQIKNIIPFLSKLKNKHHVRLVYVLTVSDVSIISEMTDIKFIDEKELLWNEMSGMYKTQLNDELYQEDKEVCI